MTGGWESEVRFGTQYDTAIEAEVQDLVASVTSDRRAANLRTLTVQRVHRRGIGLFAINTSSAYVFEQKDGRWQRAGEEALRESIERQGFRQVGGKK